MSPPIETVDRDGPLGAIEPVHWGARLIRSTAHVYTEVGGTPLLIRADDGDVQVLTPTWAAIWARLDGRPVSESLGVDPAGMDPVDGRNLIEALRRLKAAEVVVDVDPTATSTAEAGDPFGQDTLSGHVDLVFDGSVTRQRRSTSLTVDAGADVPVGVRVTMSPQGPILWVRRRFRRRVVDRFAVVDTGRGRTPTTPVDVFVTLVRALGDRSVLVRPALVDLLAELAEHAAAQGSPARSG